MKIRKKIFKIEKKVTMDLDNILEHIGELGKYQKTNYLLVCLPVLFGAANSLTYVFTAAVPKYRYVKYSHIQ